MKSLEFEWSCVVELKILPIRQQLLVCLEATSSQLVKPASLNLTGRGQKQQHNAKPQARFEGAMLSLSGVTEAWTPV